jgi:septal ring factor EnvC (AmiA/AmiB activator)
MAVQVTSLERTVEDRVARLESHVEHIQTDITEIKTNVRRLEEKLDQRSDSLKDSISALHLSMEKSFFKLTWWGFTLYFALATSLLGVMAKSFGWIN